MAVPPVLIGGIAKATKWNETDYFLVHNKTLPIPKVGNYCSQLAVDIILQNIWRNMGILYSSIDNRILLGTKKINCDYLKGRYTDDPANGASVPHPWVTNQQITQPILKKSLS